MYTPLGNNAYIQIDTVAPYISSLYEDVSENEKVHIF